MTTHVSAPPLLSPAVVVQSLMSVHFSTLHFRAMPEGVVTVMMQHIARRKELLTRLNECGCDLAEELKKHKKKKHACMESIVNYLHIQVSFEINTLIIVFFSFLFSCDTRLKCLSVQGGKKAIQGKQLWN